MIDNMSRMIIIMIIMDVLTHYGRSPLRMIIILIIMHVITHYGRSLLVR